MESSNGSVAVYPCVSPFGEPRFARQHYRRARPRGCSGVLHIVYRGAPLQERRMQRFAGFYIR